MIDPWIKQRYDSCQPWQLPRVKSNLLNQLPYVREPSRRGELISWIRYVDTLMHHYGLTT